MKTINLSGENLPVSSVYCIGRNFVDHAKELNNEVPSSPLVFLKPQSALCGDGADIIIPEESKDVHHEVEMVLFIEKEGKNISEEDALNYLGGVGIGIDFTARDIQQKAKEKGHPWSVAKGFDTFAPVSAFITTDSISSLDEMDVTLLINNEVRQSGNTSDMIFSPASLISYLSKIFTLQRGDLIFTGTPSGVSAIKSGDHIKANLGNDLVTLKVTVK